MSQLTWDLLRETSTFTLQRAGRFLAAALTGDHLVLSTSVRNGGQTDHVRFLVNHQSCEATQHHERYEFIHAQGQEAYHDVVCGEIALPSREVALMGTAANMNYATVVTCEDDGVKVTAVVTAGVQSNAACAGDPAAWREGEKGWQKLNGTINTMLLINRPVTAPAMAGSAVIMTEAKAAALQRLSVRSQYSGDLATGTGTDQFAIAAPLHGERRLTSASSHVKLGELIGRSVRDATLEALRWQNGLEPSYGRSIFSALQRFGLHEDRFFDDIAPLLGEKDLDLLRKNSKSVFYEPLVGGAAYAIAALLDRLRYGTLPSGSAHEALRLQAATISVSLSARPYLWEEFRAQLTDTDPVRLVLHAIALGWAAKWRP
jgi:adenosylcobinamide amidohydrolase